MRVMVMVKATKSSEAGEMADRQLLAEMGNYNEELVKAGIMVANMPTNRMATSRIGWKSK